MSEASLQVSAVQPQDAPKTPKKGLALSAILVSSMTLLSRIFGFARDVVIAHVFGVTAAIDAFWVAFKIPNFFRRLFAEGAFTQAFVPVLSEYKTTKSAQEAKQFIDDMAGILAVTLMIFTLLAILLAPLIIFVFSPGFYGGDVRFDLATTMMRITFPYLFFISLTAFAGGILNSHGVFGVPAFTPVLLNLSVIGATYGLQSTFAQPEMALAWGVLIGGVVQLLFQIPFLLRIGCLPKPRLFKIDPGVKKVGRLMLPALFGVSVAQLNLLIDTLFASFLTVGSVTWLYYSDRLIGFPLGIVGVGIATVILPNLSRQYSVKSRQAFSDMLSWGMKIIFGIAFPAAVGLMTLGGPIIVCLFQYGQFTALDATMVHYSLMAFAAGIPAFMGIKVLASAYYARQDVKTPVRAGVIAMICNVLLNLILIKPLAHAGLALATTLAAYINLLYLMAGLLRHEIWHIVSAWRGFVLKACIASLMMGTFVWLVSPQLMTWLHWSATLRFWHLSLVIFPAMFIYVSSMWLLGIRLSELKQD